MGRSKLLPGLLLGLLLLPCITAWLDVARSASGDRYAYRSSPRRVIVLGFDGVDPKILGEYLGRLPAIRTLAEEGSFAACRTTNPPESPVAWATFATGRNPGGHGIFDFVRRDLDARDTYQPKNGMVDRVPPIFGRFGFPIRPPRAINRRKGEPFWDPISRAGYRVSILRMPLTFPAELARGGELLAGLGVPDLRATNGSYTLFAAGPDANEGDTEFGGRHLKIYPDAGRADSRLEGPPDPRRPNSGARLWASVRFRFAVDSASVAVGDGNAVPLQPGLYSEWVPVVFRAGPLVRLKGLVRFLLLRGGKYPAVYASPIQIAPHAPPVPISVPRGFAGEMAERVGLRKTSGWPEDTFAANDGVLDDVMLFRDIRDTYRANERVLLDRLDHGGASLVAMVFTATDRMSHMFFRYRDKQHPAHNPARIADFVENTAVQDPILESYRWMDETVAQVRARMGDDDVLLIVSDHGFHSWRYGVNLNTWLLENGYLALKDSTSPRTQRNLKQFFGTGISTGEIDWSRTRAYALGLGQIYLNKAGRESEGIVGDGAALREEIAGKLARLRGPDGKPAFTTIHEGERIFHGAYMRDAPDLQCAFASGYRVSWQTALLGVPRRIFEPNLYPWSGDHCSNDAAQTPGIFLSNRELLKRDPALEDIARTVCALFDLEPPQGAEGRDLFR
ncbi:MAG: alkaline phosphatase family protein [Planctomycetota bacterium]|jgi:predicted AlkP superfamily phosphohydrolase/phosphomutase